MRNSSLVERSCAENNRALNILPKLWIDLRISGRGALQYRRSQAARSGGGTGKENVGMSNDKIGEIPIRRKTKVSLIYANQIRVSRALRCSRKAKPMENRLIFLYLYYLRWGDGDT